MLGAIVVSAAALAGCRDSLAPLSDPRGLLLISRGSGASTEIYVVRPDGSEARRLTRNAYLDGDAAWSPDGRRIVFVSFQDSVPGQPTRRPDIFVMNADGSGRRRIFQSSYSAYSPRWSPDGRRIAFQQYHEAAGINGIYLMNADGSDVHALAGASGGMMPDWSPDGTRILFVAPAPPHPYWTLHVAQADGSGAVAIGGTTACAGNAYEARWSPDASRIAYTCDEGLHLMRADGSDARALDVVAWSPTWSPDGATLALSVYTGSGGPPTRVVLRNVATGATSPLNGDTASTAASSWSRPTSR